MSKNSVAAYVAIIAAMLFWSLSFIWYKEAYVSFSPIAVIFLRLTIATILLVIVALTLLKTQKVNRKHYMLFVWLAFFEPFLYFMAEAHGIKYISATAASVIIALIPLLTPFAAFIFLKIKLKALHLAGLAISFTGVGLVVFAGSNDVSADALGISLMFVAVISALGYSMILVKLLKFYNTITVMVYQNLISLLFFLPFFLVLEWKGLMEIPFTLGTYLPILKLGFFASFLAFTLFVFSIKRIGITIANMFTYLIPAFTAIFAFFILDEDLYVQTAVGIIVVIFGLILPHLPSLLKPKNNEPVVSVEEALQEPANTPIIP
jgi:drug/metabolite transporter (DMT)-like permease